jgi:CheY-like chemotaxis protein
MTNERALMTLPVVLVVDDDLFARQLVARQLNGMAIVVEAQDGDDALDIFRQFRFDLVISDLDMPRLRGSALMRALSAIDPEGRRMIVTGGAGEEIDALLREGVVQGYVAKPFTARRLRQAVTELLEAEGALVDHTASSDSPRSP